MELQKTTGICHAEPDNRRAEASSWMIGAFFFLLVVEFFGIRNLKDVAAGELILSGLVPMLLAVAYLLLIRVCKCREILPLYNKVSSQSVVE